MINRKYPGLGPARFGLLLLLIISLFLLACPGRKQVEKEKKEVQPVSWPIFRGDSRLTGTVNNQKFLQGDMRKAQSAGRKANNTIDAVRQEITCLTPMTMSDEGTCGNFFISKSC
jgi:hypothetical protein